MAPSEPQQQPPGPPARAKRGRRRKLLILAHTPPPHHGQSFMVEQVWHGLRGSVTNSGPVSMRDDELECFHVNCRYSGDVEAIGRIQARKILLVLKYCAQAIWHRIRNGVRAFYYVPAPPSLRSALYRDWVVMLLCRPFFRIRIYHWQAAGLAEWLHRDVGAIGRWLTFRLLGRPGLSIVLTPHNRADGEWFESARTAVIPNFIPDPCPDFEQVILPERRRRLETRRQTLRTPSAEATIPGESSEASPVFRVLFVGLCSRSKGLFDTIEAVASVNRRLIAEQLRLRVQLDVAGAFWRDDERREFEARIRQPDLVEPGGRALVIHHGFVRGADKSRLFGDCDCLCFPTFYEAESFPLVLLEAMAYDLPIITTNWRMLPDLLPARYPGIVDPGSPERVAGLIRQFMDSPPGVELRRHFLEHYTDDTCLRLIREELDKLDL